MKHTENQIIKYDPNNEKTWSVEDQPSAKLAQKGSNHLTDTELVSVLLNGMANASTVARSLYTKADNNLNTLSHFSIEQLTKVEGITEKKAVTIHAAFELGRRNNEQPQELTPVRSSETINHIMKPIIGDAEHEEFWLICLNRSNRVIKKHKISQGGLTGTVVDTRIILKKALDSLSSSIIVSHNHPSGNTQPSDADITITKKIKSAAEIMEIKLLDHVILTKDSYFSFADDGLI